ncbi:MAG: hypothetical protein HQK64_04825 [Desulfamplus sp.]|nr:hypothetical protein [Desulfamplus sp.]
MDTLSTTNNSNSLISELKRFVLLIESGAIDDVSQQIIKITDSLALQWQHDKIIGTFIKMIRALADYVASKKGNVSADVISLIESLTNQVSRLTTPPDIDLSLSKKQAILSEEIAKYNSLKQQIKSGSQQKGSDSDYSPEINIGLIAEIKSVILSLEWEITDELIHKLDGEVQKLQSHWQNSKIHLSFLQMFKSIGSYLISKGASSHPDSILLLNSLYKNFEQIALNPNISMAEKKDILMGDMKRFNEFKQLVASSSTKPASFAPVAPTPPKSAPLKQSAPVGVSPMDDLIGTKSSSNLSPVDDLIEEIHMLQESGGSSSDNRGGYGSGGGVTNPEIKEVIPNRLKTQPISEIQTRLDAFFDEDEPLSDFSFADSGDEVVPYKDDSTNTSHATYQEVALPEQAKEEYDGGELIFDDTQIAVEQEEIKADIDEIKEAVIPPKSSDDSIVLDGDDLEFEELNDSEVAQAITDDGMVPYEFEDDLFEEEDKGIEASTDFAVQVPTVDAKKEQVSKDAKEDDIDESVNVVADIQNVEANGDDMELIEELQSAVGMYLAHIGSSDVDAIKDKIDKLERGSAFKSDRLILLGVIKNLVDYLKTSSSEQPSSLAQAALSVEQSLSQQASLSAELNEEHNNQEDDLDIEKKLTKPVGFWDKIKKIFGF